MGLLSSLSARAKMVLDGRAPEEGGPPSEPPLAAAPDAAAADSRQSWEAICRCDEFRGRWVALDRCRYDEETGRATEGAVVDADDDLVELCGRIRESERKNCAILFCGEDGEQGPCGRH